MNVSLNKANKLRNLLETFVAAARTKVETASVVRIAGYETTTHSLNARITEQFLEGEEAFQAYSEGMDALYMLRTLIQQANASNGVNTAISDMVKCTQYLKGIEQILASIKSNHHRGMPFADEMSVADVLRHNQSSESTMRGGISGILVHGPTVKKFESLVADLSKEIRRLEEVRNELNHKNYIELPKLVSEFLESADLI